MAAMHAPHFSVDAFKNWDKGGKTEFVKQCKLFISSAKDSSLVLKSSNESKDIKYIIYELSKAALNGIVKVDQVVSVFNEIHSLHHEIPSIITDVLALLDIETQIDEDKIQRDKIISLISSLSGPVLPMDMVKIHVDVDTLAEAGIVKNAKNANQKLVRKKTRLFYKQKKFNLFREESEGFGKLVAELNQEISGSVNSEYVFEVVKSLIGCFNLDPNKVLDVILESFESNLNQDSFFVNLLQAYSCNSTTLSQVLGFKYSFHNKEPEKLTPSSLYVLTALLLRNNLITLDEIYPFLYPSDSEINDQYKTVLNEARTYARRANIIMTTGNDESKDEDKEIGSDKFQTNQKLGLCEALLRIGDWNHAKDILARLPDHYATAYVEVAKALGALIHSTIDPLYRKYHGLSKLVKSSPVPPFSGNHIPKRVSAYDELREDVLPMVRALGPHINTDPVLMVKIVRIAKTYISKKKDFIGASNPANEAATMKQDLQYDFLTVIDEVLLPSLSLMECNCCMSEELWSLIKLYSYQQRYLLYGRWKNDSYNHHPKLIRTKADTIKRIKYIMKRLVKESVKPTGRQIGKLSHSNPGFLFDFILSQIQAWDNLISPVVDSLKYLSKLSYDVLAYCIVEALSNPEKEQMKHDGFTIGLWMQSLSNFCGSIFKKYNIDLTGLLQYLTNQLKAEKSLDLLILRETIQKMAGIEASEQVTDNQLEAMAGGDLLKAEGGYFSQVRNTKKSSQRLKDALIEQDLALPLCLLMAQQRYGILYGKSESKTHLKLMGNLYDQAQDTLVQFGNFLATTMSMEDYVRRLPSMHQLLTEYHINADVAFFLARPMINYTLNSKYDEIRKQDKAYRNATSSQKLQKYNEAVELIMNPIIESIRSLHMPKVWEDISPQFFVTFWFLSMYDLRVPTACYENEINKLKLQMQQIEDNKDLVPSKKRKQKEQCHNLIEKLNDEERRQTEHVARVLSRLHNEKETWFTSRSAKNETITQFLKMCIFPRCIFTANDAVFCAQFVHTIHTLKTPSFSTLICYDRIFCDITYTITSCTENEAHRYGRFLNAMLEMVMKWHSSKAIFDKQCANFPGFMTKFRGATQSSDSTSDHVDYENYRHVCHKWHFKITKALVICLESEDYVQIRNTLIVLTKIITYYPKVANLGQALERRIEKIKVEEKEKRADIYALAVSYAGQLKARKTVLIPESEFHFKEVKDQAVKSEEMKQKSSSASNKASTNPTTKDKPSKESSIKDKKPVVAASDSSKNADIKVIDQVSTRSSTNSSSVANSIHLKRESNGSVKTMKERRSDHGVNDKIKDEKPRDIKIIQRQDISSKKDSQEVSHYSSSTASGIKRHSMDPPLDSEKDLKRHKSDSLMVKTSDCEREAKLKDKVKKEKSRSKSNSAERESEDKKSRSHVKDDRDKKLERKRERSAEEEISEKRKKSNGKTKENGSIEKKVKVKQRIVVEKDRKKESSKDEKRHHRSSSKRKSSHE